VERSPGPLSLASTAVWAAALVLAAIVGLDFYLVSHGLGTVEFKARQEGSAVYLEAPVRNEGYLPLGLRVTLRLCQHTYTWQGTIPPGGEATARLRVDPHDLGCKPEWSIGVSLGAMVSAEIRPAAG